MKENKNKENEEKKAEGKLKNIGISTLKVFIKYILVFIILLGTYFVLLTLSSLFPSSALEKNVKKSSEKLLEDGEKVTIDLKYKEENLLHLQMP